MSGLLDAAHALIDKLHPTSAPSQAEAMKPYQQPALTALGQSIARKTPAGAISDALRGALGRK